ncbi:MAG: TraC family protein [Patescibacteria group bacterium]
MANTPEKKNATEVKKESETKNQRSSTLNFLEIAEIRDSVCILKENEMRTVIAVSSANFALKSYEEQNKIIGAFQGILNSIDFPIQISLQSRKLDLNNYLDKLKTLEYQQKNDLLRVKMQEYVAYIESLLSEYNIMNKDFYVVVGYEPVKLKEDIFTQIKKIFQPVKYIRMEREEFLNNRKQLMSRVDNIASKLSSLDLKTEVLNTEQLIALYYNSYNIDSGNYIKLGNISDLNIEY